MLLEETIKTLNHKYINFRSSTRTLKNDIVKIYFDSPHYNFVIVPIDKANGNIAVICKHFNMGVSVKELGMNNKVSANTTYKYLTVTNRVFNSFSI